MYTKLPNLILAFHGCHVDVARKVLVEGDSLRPSNNKYDWLGNGIYFWEQNYKRAYEWALDRYGNEGAVIGAVLDLGYCLNLTDTSSIELLETGYNLLKMRCDISGIKIPENKASKKSSDILLRDLDCAVIEQIHDFNKENNLTEYDSVRGVFTEGLPPYPGAAFLSKTHIQICIRNTACIKGYFRPVVV